MKLVLALSLSTVLCACAPAPAPVAARALVSDLLPLSAGPIGSITRGAAFAQVNCSSCHALGTADTSPLPAAPPLRDISRRYPVEQLGEAFAEGFVSTHSTMPEFVLDARQNRDLLAYLASIQTE